MSEQEPTPLQRWLADRAMTITELSDRMDWRYNYVADIVRGSRPVSDGFRWRFGEVYGFAEAQALLAEEQVA